MYCSESLLPPPPALCKWVVSFFRTIFLKAVIYGMSCSILLNCRENRLNNLGLDVMYIDWLTRSNPRHIINITSGSFSSSLSWSLCVWTLFLPGMCPGDGGNVESLWSRVLRLFLLSPPDWVKLSLPWAPTLAFLCVLDKGYLLLLPALCSFLWRGSKTCLVSKGVIACACSWW